MIDLANDVASDEYARLFRMLSAVNKEAESLHLATVVHLTNMALLLSRSIGKVSIPKTRGA